MSQDRLSKILGLGELLEPGHDPANDEMRYSVTIEGIRPEPPLGSLPFEQMPRNLKLHCDRDHNRP